MVPSDVRTYRFLPDHAIAESLVRIPREEVDEASEEQHPDGSGLLV